MAFIDKINRSLENLALEALSGNSKLRIDGVKETSLFGSGVELNLGKDEISSITPLQRSAVSITPRASIIVKKKFFAGFKQNNDLQWMDKTEKLLLRSTKALFAYKVSQIRAYESLTKLEDFYRNYSQVNLNLFVDAYNQSKFLNVPAEQTSGDLLSIIAGAISNSLSNLAYDDYKNDILKILQRQAFADDLRLTTWIVDPTSIDNYSTGPGTGVIEFTNVSSFNTTTSTDSSASPARFTMTDPYRMMNISSDDIEVAINEALLGNVGLFEAVINGDVGIENIDTTSVISSGLELLGLGNLDGTINLDYVRDRLRVFFLGKTLVNAGDTVHFFIRSDKAVHENSDFLDESYFEIDETILEAERNLFTNKSIDLETYKKLRMLSDNSFGMRHVYAGIATQPSQSYRNGSWSIDISVEDNMKWLQWSRYMHEPALSDPQGVLEDPLTPYELEKDASGRVLSSGGVSLLTENRQLINSGLLVYDSGIFNGQFATESNLLQGQYNGGGSMQNSKVLQHPSGLVYRWKSGILTATAPINVLDPTNEDSISQNIYNQVYGQNVAQDVLNNLDVANILSLLIVGQPYNVESFMQQTFLNHGINKAGSNAALNSLNPLTSVLDVLRRQNQYFGNFRPYRMITLSDQTVNESFSSNLLRNEINDKLVKLRSRRLELSRKLDALKSINGPESLLSRSLEGEISDINQTINDQVKLAMTATVSTGDVLTENFNLFGNNRVLPLTGNYTADANVTRAMTIVGSQRRIEDVRLNRDQNLFIISDQYDENTDIRPFLLALRDAPFKVFEGTYVSVYEKCEAAAKIPNFEFFCSSQGHLEFRPPQWNRTPLSVLQQLFLLKNQQGFKIIPDFLEDLFATKAASLRINIHKLNIRIAITALLLGKYPDQTLLPGISRVGINSLAFFGIKAAGADTDVGGVLSLRNSTQTGLAGLSSAINTLFGDQLSLDISLGEEGDILNGDTVTMLGVFDPIFQEQNSILQGILSVASAPGGASAVTDGYSTPQALNTLRDSFRTTYGFDPAAGLTGGVNTPFVRTDFAYADPSTPNDKSDVITKINKYLSEIQQAVSERDQLVSSLVQVEQKQEEMEEVESIISGEFLEPEEQLPPIIETLDKAYNTTKTINDIFTGTATQGTTFDHLIEDDSRNLLGPGSGRRFVVHDRDIISADFSEDIPDFTRVNVLGNNAFIGAGLQEKFGNRYYWAGATDFDMWRQYGYIEAPDISLPYANNSETQCRPFANISLQIQRTKINTGTLEVVGNEYYEPGDTIYIPTKGLLYYISSVSHTFAYGTSFTTSLTLINGHPPGVYLPSPMDIIGQQYLKNDPTATLLTYRNIYGDDSYRALQPESAIMFPPGPTLNSESTNVLLDYRDNQIRYTNMMIDLSSVILGNKKVLIRGFIKNDVDKARVQNNLSVIKQLLLNPVMITQEEPLQNQAGFSNLGDDLLDSGSSALRGLGVETGSTKGTTSMILPNGMPVIQLSPEQIIEQLVTLGPEPSSEIKCINSALSEQLSTGDISIMPKGGPKQRTWLDFRDDLTQISNIIEIGILNVDQPVEPKTEGGVNISVEF